MDFGADSDWDGTKSAGNSMTPGASTLASTDAAAVALDLAAASVSNADPDSDGTLDEVAESELPQPDMAASPNIQAAFAAKIQLVNCADSERFDRRGSIEFPFG
ncbi:MAG: hypothetical protein WBD31_22845 [Rubripirellula sp.]